jgi:hypothetical protein
MHGACQPDRGSLGGEGECICVRMGCTDGGVVDDNVHDK